MTGRPVDGRRAGMKNHFRRYAMAYLVGSLFMLWQFVMAFKTAGAALTPSIRSTMGEFDWAIFFSNVLILCLPTILAFLNQSVAKGSAPTIAPAPDEDPALAVAVHVGDPVLDRQTAGGK